MKTLTLQRITETMWGTFGALYSGNDFLCATLERKWEDDKPDISSIPAGEYTSKRTNSPHFGNTFEIVGVKDRSAILFHKGNYQTDSKGCVIIATGYAPLNGQLAVTSSGEAFARFLDFLKSENEFNLIVKNP